MKIKSHLFALAVGISFVLGPPRQGRAEIESNTGWGSVAIVDIPSNGGLIQASVQKLQFTWKRSTDRYLEHHDIIAVIIPSKNLYWLGEASDLQVLENRRINRQYLVLGDSIVAISMHRGGFLRFHISTGRLAAIEHTSEEIDRVFHQKLEDIETRKWDKGIPFNIEKVLGAFPFTGLGSAMGEPAPTITKIDVSDTAFTIELAGGKNSAVKATITFDDSFRPLKATLRGKNVFPK